MRGVLDLLDDTQMRVLIGYKPKTSREARLHAAILLLMRTGPRISEALALRDCDLDLHNLLMKVFGKGQKEHIPGDYVVAGLGGAPWEKRNATTSQHLLLHKLKLPRFGCQYT